MKLEMLDSGTGILDFESFRISKLLTVRTSISMAHLNSRPFVPVTIEFSSVRSFHERSVCECLNVVTNYISESSNLESIDLATGKHKNVPRAKMMILNTMFRSPSVATFFRQLERLMHNH